jgi:hypothetical protein
MATASRCRAARAAWLTPDEPLLDSASPFPDTLEAPE